MFEFPFDKWGKVKVTAQAGRIEKIKVTSSSGGGFLICTLENGSEFDTWVETVEEVAVDLAGLEIEWPLDEDA